jgi:hypothetical protein
MAMLLLIGGCSPRSRSPPSPDYEAEKPDKAVEQRCLTL